MSDVTAVVSFGEAADTDFAVIDFDGDVTAFLPGDDVFILVHHGDDVDEIRAVDTANGTIERLGTVIRENEVELSFAPDKAVAELPHIPTGAVSVSSFGVESQIEADGLSKQVLALTMPVVVNVKYSYKATRYRYRLPDDFVLSGDSFPVDFYVETGAK